MGQLAYACLRDARAEIHVQSASDTSGDAYLLNALRFASERINALTGTAFAPRIATRYQNAKGVHIDPDTNVLYLDADLLEVTSVTEGTSTSLTEDTHYVLHPRNSTPALGLRMLYDSAYDWTSYTEDWQDAISVTGVWGYHNDYGNAWVNTGDTVQDTPLEASATTLTVGDADGTDAYNRTRFSPGQLLKVESEYITVMAVNTTSNVLTVLRGQQGSTAAEHAASTAIYVWEPEQVIQRATLQWAAYMYARKGNFEETKFDGMATVSYPPDAPQPVMNTLRESGLLYSIRRPF